MSSFCLHASPEALAPLANSIVENPLIHSWPHTRLHSSHIWPPNSPDFNLVDNKMWSVMQGQVYQTPILDVNALKQRLLNEWAAGSEDYLLFRLLKF